MSLPDNPLARQIQTFVPEPGGLAIYWLCQSGIVFKGGSGRVVCIDPYFSDVVEKKFGFARMMACPMAAEDLDADLVICTHEHLDHMDTDALPVIARNSRIHFAGPIECYKAFQELGISINRCHLLSEGQSIQAGGVTVHGVFADHGIHAPDALGVVVDFGGIRVYHTGDTAYRPDQFGPAIDFKPDVLIPCINGRYGNMNATEAAQLCSQAQPRLCIASHFWMFVQHNGDPGLFLSECNRLAPEVEAVVMKPGGVRVFPGV